ncbi:MAG: hypothetical protein K0Q57_102 [Gammaproteobacteria bacterium]|jgi:hypothetical protein|nr:hypothetical protein [Gammaproteobacteria bacterium]
MLKPQDIVILLKILANKLGAINSFSQSNLATHLCMSVSEVNAGIKRLTRAELLGLLTREEQIRNRVFQPIKPACEECLISGVKYFLPAQLGEYTRGIVTSYAAPAFKKQILIGRDPVPVWPYAEGDQLGLALEPLYSSVPKSITHYPDPLFYELLVLVDAIRSGRARERNIAIKLLREKLTHDK